MPAAAWPAHVSTPLCSPPEIVPIACPLQVRLPLLVMRPPDLPAWLPQRVPPSATLAAEPQQLAQRSRKHQPPLRQPPRHVSGLPRQHLLQHLPLALPRLVHVCAEQAQPAAAPASRAVWAPGLPACPGQQAAVRAPNAGWGPGGRGHTAWLPALAACAIPPGCQCPWAAPGRPAAVLPAGHAMQRGLLDWRREPLLQGPAPGGPVGWDWERCWPARAAPVQPLTAARTPSRPGSAAGGGCRSPAGSSAACETLARWFQSTAAAGRASRPRQFGQCSTLLCKLCLRNCSSHTIASLQMAP